MKTFFKSMMLAAVSAMAFSSCSETFDDIVTGDAAVDMVELTISTERPEMMDTRTMVDTDGKTPLWCVGDAIGVSVFAGGSYTNYEFTSDCTEASKVTTFTGKTPVGDMIYTYYPYSANGVDAEGVTVVEIPAVQHPTATSFDGSADLLVGKPMPLSSETSTVEGLQFKRVGGFLKIVLKEQDGSTLAGQIVEKVSVTAEQPLAGKASLDIVNGVLGEAAADGSKTVTAEYTSATGFAVDGDGAAWLGVYPQTLAAGTKLTVSAVTTHYQVEREIELPYDIEIAAGRITTLNVKITAENISEKTLEFPDPIFREYVLANFDTDKDGKISVEEALKVTRIEVNRYYSTLDNEKIALLEGIQYFTNLTFLDCEGNRLTSLDVSNNTALTYLYCGYNQLTSLDVSRNTALTSLTCGGNQLMTLDVSQNTALTSLTCNGNPLATLDVSQNTALTGLDCRGNQLTTLDVSNNLALEKLSCFSNQLTTLDVSNNLALTYLSCENNQLTSLDVSHNIALTQLYCDSNYLTTLDVSNNTALTRFYCSYNNITSLNVSNNSKLTRLCCDGNRLTTLDLSNNTALQSLECGWNRLTSLDVSKTNLGNSTYSSPLNCRDMDMLDILYLKTGWEINGITKNRSTGYIPEQTRIVFIDGDYGEEGEAGGELGDDEDWIK